MSKKVCFSIYSYSPHYHEMALALINSCKYFHPEIPIEFFEKDQIDKIMKERNIPRTVLLPFLGEILSEKYDLVIHIDADSIITAPLTELLEEEYDFASVRNNNDFGFAGKGNPGFSRINPLNSKYIELNEYLNAGLHACTNKQFWKEWQKYNVEYSKDCLLGDQDVMNDVFYSGNYKTVVIDSQDRQYYYGVANSWGIDSHYESWKQIILKDDKLFLFNKQVKVLHAASGEAEVNKFDIDKMFRSEVSEWLKKIISGNK